MKIKSCILIAFFFLAIIALHAQSGMTVQGGGAVTINGNTTIIECSVSPPTTGINVSTSVQITWNWNAVPGASGYKWNTINDYNTAIDVGPTTSKIETGLSYNTTYTRYIWAYVVIGSDNATSTTHSTLPGPVGCGTITDTRDGKTYTTVQIGTQCWMAQNLNVGTRIVGSSNQTNNSIIEKYCYGGLEANCNTYGGLYQWDEAMQYSTIPGVQGICPTGWHLPTDAEWTTLTTFLGGESIAGGKMKESGLAHWLSPNTGATNSSGFTALPGGCRYDFGSFYDLTYYANFWSSSQYDATSAWGWYLYYNFEIVGRYADYKTYSFSARCLKDN